VTSSPEQKRPFRFFDNREKYLMFVTTCSEKAAVAERVGVELVHLQPKPPALRLFDAGVGDGTVLTRVMRQMHRRFPTVPFLAVGKEISLEDVRLSLEKMADRFHEHPQMVLVMTNMYYYESPRLWPRSSSSVSALNWTEVQLKGETAHEFDEQIRSLHPMLAEWWQVRASEKTGNPLYVRPSVLVIYREDQRFVLDPVIPHKGQADGLYDLVIAAQPYRARMPAETKVQYVLEPLARALAPGGRMVAIQSTGKDPGMEIVRRIWPDENPFKTPRRVLLKVLQDRLRASLPDLQYHAYSDKKSLFRFALHVMPSEVTEHIGTSTLFAGWNAAVYVAQIDDERLSTVMTQSDYLKATQEVMTEHGGLWFADECFVVARNKL